MAFVFYVTSIVMGITYAFTFNHLVGFAGLTCLIVAKLEELKERAG